MQRILSGMIICLVIFLPNIVIAANECELKCLDSFNRLELMCRNANQSDLTQCTQQYNYCMDSCLFGHIGLCGHQCRSDLSICLNIAASAFKDCSNLIMDNALTCLVGCGWIIVNN